MILSIESSTSISSISIYNSGKILSYCEFSIEKSHASLFSPTIKDLLTRCKLTISDIQAVAISAGPGSYTGLRIGTSTAKGLCYAYSIPLIAVDTLKSMALEVKTYIEKIVDKNTKLIPMIDGRKMGVYTTIYNMEMKNLSEIVLKKLKENTFKEELEKGKLVFFGNRIEKYKELIKHTNAIFLPNVNPSAKYSGILANEQFINSDFVDLTDFEPLYLKNFFITSHSQKK